VRDLLKHMVSANLRFAAAARGDDPDAACAPDEAELGDDPAASFRGSANVVTEAFGVPAFRSRRPRTSPRRCSTAPPASRTWRAVRAGHSAR
jgi:hypothetical protein